MADVHISEWNGITSDDILQKLEEKAAKAQEAFEKEEKLRKEVEAIANKLQEEKTDLLSKLQGEQGSLSETQERANKLQAQKSDLENQLRVSHNHFLCTALYFYFIIIHKRLIMRYFKILCVTET